MFLPHFDVFCDGPFQEISLTIPQMAFLNSKGKGGSLNWKSKGMGKYNCSSKGMGGFRSGTKGADKSMKAQTNL